MSIRPGRWMGLAAVLAVTLAHFAACAQDTPPDTALTDTTTFRQPPSPPDSVREATERKVADILKWLNQTKADSADTVQPLPAPVQAPADIPLGQARVSALTFPVLAAFPHTAFSDHLLESVEFDAVGTTEYATERMFSYRGLNPLLVEARLDGGHVDLRRLTFPQTMAPDLMAVPPYLFSSFTFNRGVTSDRGAESLKLRTVDSLSVLPVSDFFVRRGDYGLSLTQGRLFRPLPGRRTVALGFSFAQSDGRWAGNFGNSGGDNRYLHGRFSTPLRRGYNLLLEFYQNRAQSDIQTAWEWWRYNFRRDDLNWHTSALLFRGDSTIAPLLVRLTVRHGKQDVRSQTAGYRAWMKTGHAELAATYHPALVDSTRQWRAGGSLALEQLHVRSDHVRRPEYVFWGEYFRRATERQTLHVSARVDGNDHDLPGPQLTGEWGLHLGAHWHTNISLQRVRIIPTPADRRWPTSATMFENPDGPPIAYTERGIESLKPWWSNSVSAGLMGTSATGLSLTMQTWGSYEQDYYSWQDVADQDTVQTYQPSAVDARTIGFAVQGNLPPVGPFSPRLGYVFKRAEETGGRRLPDYFDHRLTGAVNANLTLRKFNLNLHGSAEFMYWRAPTPQHTAYNTRDVFRTDVLGSATIKDFTIYWLAQNLFNYGYCKEPGFNYTGRTVMWGLHLRFFN